MIYLDSTPVLQYGTPDHEEQSHQDQQLQAVSQELVALNEKIDSVLRETEAMNLQAQSLEKKTRSLNRVSNFSLAMGGALAISILYYGVQHLNQRYFA